MLSVTPHFDKLLDGVLESRPISQHTWLFAKFPLTPALEKRERERGVGKKNPSCYFSFFPQAQSQPHLAGPDVCAHSLLQDQHHGAAQPRGCCIVSFCSLCSLYPALPSPAELGWHTEVLQECHAFDTAIPVQLTVLTVDLNDKFIQNLFCSPWLYLLPKTLNDECQCSSSSIRVWIMKVNLIS